MHHVSVKKRERKPADAFLHMDAFQRGQYGAGKNDNDRQTSTRSKEIHITKSGQIVGISQHLHYLHRCGKCDDKSVEINEHPLFNINFLEYSTMIAIVPKSKAAPKDKKSSGKGRTPNKRFPFASNHPMANTHVQRLRTKFMVPILASKPRPPPPGPVPDINDPT